MKFELTKASTNDDDKSTVDVNTLDDLKDLSEKNGDVRLILNFHGSPMYGEAPSIILYDDYVE